MSRWIAATVLLLAAGELSAGADQAHINYMLHCQGCHLPDATGSPGSVPAMKDAVGYFLHSPEGREYLIRVPGVATSELTDAETAELMNWVLTTYSAAQLPPEFEPFTSEEVARLRKTPEVDPATTRQQILENVARATPALDYSNEGPR